jgi:CNT family concentrative nucleoside transporter
VVLLAALAYLADRWIGPRGRAALGVVCFVGIAGVFSANLRAINWRTVGWGFALQVGLALCVLKLGFTRPTPPEQVRQFQAQQAVALLGTGHLGPLHALPLAVPQPPQTSFYRPGYEAFRAIGGVVKKFLEFSSEGARFVFGGLADPGAVEKALGPGNGFVFAFVALPTVVFVSSFFSVLYYFGLLQWVVRVFARAMRALMRTSGAETLSVTANVFMGQTEAPLIVKPYVERMTRSELLALMVGGMAHISGSLMAVYIGMGADAVAILATSVMASPCTLYMAKIMLPEMGTPETAGTKAVQTAPVEQPHANVIDAAAAGASDGMRLAINIAAMLIAFLAFIALFNSLLQLFSPGLTLSYLFGKVFAPLAHLMGVEAGDVGPMGTLLGTKLVANEFVAYTEFQAFVRAGAISERTRVLATYALTGFANFASIGIQLGGIGAMAPSRRPDLARLGGRALLTGFLVTLVNAAVAGVLL